MTLQSCRGRDRWQSRDVAKCNEPIADRGWWGGREPERPRFRGAVLERRVAPAGHRVQIVCQGFNPQ